MKLANAELNKSIMLKERYYKRNYIALILEGFFFSFALSIFSHATVLPVYISNITENSMWISVLGMLFFTFSNGAAVFSAILGINATSPKWLSVKITALQRIGFILIYFSTWSVLEAPGRALTLFFLSYSVYAITAGLSLPVFSNMVSTVIHRNVSGFYGSYTLSGALAGILGSEMIRVLLERYDFPVDYQYMFLAGVVMAVIATFVVAVLVKEVAPPKPKIKAKFSELPAMMKTILVENQLFRNFLTIKVFVAIAEIAIPFYIIKMSRLPNVTPGFVGRLSLVLLVSNVIFSKVLGYIGDKWGPFAQIGLASAAGLTACILVLNVSTISGAYFLFVLVSLATLGVVMSTNVSSIVFSPAGRVPIYASINGLVVAPFYGISALGGGYISGKISIDLLFKICIVFYAIALILTFIYRYRSSRERVMLKV